MDHVRQQATKIGTIPRVFHPSGSRPGPHRVPALRRDPKNASGAGTPEPNTHPSGMSWAALRSSWNQAVLTPQRKFSSQRPSRNCKKKHRKLCLFGIFIMAGTERSQPSGSGPSRPPLGPHPAHPHCSIHLPCKLQPNSTCIIYPPC